MFIYETVSVNIKDGRLSEGLILYLGYSEEAAKKEAEYKWNSLYDENKDNIRVEVRRYDIPKETNSKDGENIAELMFDVCSCSVIYEYSYNLKKRLTEALKKNELSTAEFAKKLNIHPCQLENLPSGQEIESNIFEKKRLLEKIEQTIER